MRRRSCASHWAGTAKMLKTETDRFEKRRYAASAAGNVVASAFLLPRKLSSSKIWSRNESWNASGLNTEKPISLSRFPLTLIHRRSDLQCVKQYSGSLRNSVLVLSKTVAGLAVWSASLIKPRG
jgi:hypothetical protein